MTRLNFKCAVSDCYESTYGDRAVCGFHFALEVALAILGIVTVVGTALWALMGKIAMLRLFS